MFVAGVAPILSLFVPRIVKGTAHPSTAQAACGGPRS
jgi:hypothetical protein